MLNSGTLATQSILLAFCSGDDDEVGAAEMGGADGGGEGEEVEEGGEVGDEEGVDDDVDGEDDSDEGGGVDESHSLPSITTTPLPLPWMVTVLLVMAPVLMLVVLIMGYLRGRSGPRRSPCSRSRRWRARRFASCTNDASRSRKCSARLR